MSDSNRTGIAYAVESAWGTTPTTAFQNLRFTGESLNYNISSISSNEISSTRMVNDLVLTNKQAGGGFNFEFSYGTYDEFLAGALFSDWSTNVLKNGTTEKPFSIEKQHLDKDLYFLYKGMVANTMSLNIQSGQIVTGSFGFLGKDCTLQATTNSSPATLTAITTTTPFNAIGNVGTIQEGGGAMSGVYVQGLTISLTNNLRGQTAIGSDGFVDIGTGVCQITGTMNIYFENSTLYNKLLNNTETSFSFVLTDGATNSYTIEIPRMKYSGGSVNASGINTDVMLSMNWGALRDDTEDALIKITRAPA